MMHYISMDTANLKLCPTYLSITVISALRCECGYEPLLTFIWHITTRYCLNEWGEKMKKRIATLMLLTLVFVLADEYLVRVELTANRLTPLTQQELKIIGELEHIAIVVHHRFSLAPACRMIEI